MQLQYILSFISTNKSFAVYSNPTPKFQCTAGMPSPSAHNWALCNIVVRKYKIKLSFIGLVSYVTFSMQGEIRLCLKLFTVYGDGLVVYGWTSPLCFHQINDYVRK
jgi:hypothetical protein